MLIIKRDNETTIEQTDRPSDAYDLLSALFDVDPLTMTWLGTTPEPCPETKRSAA